MLPKRDTQDNEFRLNDYVQIVHRRKWIIIGCLVVAITFGVIHNFRAIPVYRVTAQLLIGKDNPKVISIEEVVTPDRGDLQWNQTEIKILSSRSLALRVIKALNLRDSPEFKSDEKSKRFSVRGSIKSVARRVIRALSTQEKVSIYDGTKKRGIKRNKSPELESDEKRKSFSIRGFLSSLKRRLDSKKKSLIRKLDSKKEYREHDENDVDSALAGSYLSKLRVEPIKYSRLVNISFEGTHPDIITTIVNRHAQEYIEQNHETKFGTTKDAAGWLQEQLAEKEKTLKKAETALQEYKESEKIISLEDRQNIIVQKLGELNTTLTNARTERMALETRYKLANKYSEMPEMIEAIPEVMKNQLIQNLKMKYVDLSSEITKLSDKYGEKFPTMVKLTSKAKAVNTKIDTEVNKIIKSIKADYEMALVKEENLSRALEEQKERALELDRKAISYGTLKRESESEKVMYDILLNRMKETDITGELRTSNIRIIDVAEVPKSPIKPRKRSNIILSAIIGLIMGFGVSFLVEQLDHTVKSPEDVERYLGLSLLSAFMKMKAQDGNGKKAPSFDMITHERPKSHIAEAFRHMRTNLTFSSNGNRRKFKKLMLITSVVAEEGKTFVSSNLAIAIAQIGKNVLLVDTDFRNPRLNKVFHISRKPGLTDLLIGEKTLSSVIKPTKIPNLGIITCGKITPNPAELLGSDRMEKFCMAVRRKYDVVLFDTPPSMVVTDAVVLSDILDGVIFVVKYGVHDRKVVERAISQITDKGHEVLGVVMNHIEVSSGGYYYPYYAYYYSYGYNGKGKGESKTDAETIMWNSNA